jgi:branched-chain amino acid transport system permease protein
MAQQLTNGAVLGSIYVLFALGLTLSWGVLNILNLAHGAIFMSGGLIAWQVSKGIDLPFVVLVLCSAAACGVMAVVLDVVAYRPIRRRAANASGAELSTLIASVAAASIPIAIAAKLTKAQPVGLPDDVVTVTSTTVFGQRISTIGIAIIILALALGLALTWFVRRTQTGRALRALAFDPYTCGLLGISAARLATATMFISGALAGMAGVLLAVQQDTIDANMGEPLLLKAFAVIILGGVGSIGGAIAGAYLLAFVETLTIVYVSSDLKDTAAFVLIIALLLLRPQGLFSREAWQRA